MTKTWKETQTENVVANFLKKIYEADENRPLKESLNKKRIQVVDSNAIPSDWDDEEDW